MYRPDHSIARLLQYLGLTQVDLAGYLGVSRDQLAGYAGNRQGLPPLPTFYLVHLLGQLPPAVLSDPAHRARRLWPAEEPLPLAGVLAAPGGPLLAGPLRRRQQECRLQAHRLRLEAARASRGLAQGLARQQMLPALRAAPALPPTLHDDTREAHRQRWLAWLTQDTAGRLQAYDRTAQALRVLRAESLEAEAARLQALLDALPPVGPA